MVVEVCLIQVSTDERALASVVSWREWRISSVFNLDSEVLRELRDVLMAEMSDLHLFKSCTCCARIAPARSVVAWRIQRESGCDWTEPVATSTERSHVRLEGGGAEEVDNLLEEGAEDFDGDCFLACLLFEGGD